MNATVNEHPTDQVNCNSLCYARWLIENTDIGNSNKRKKPPMAVRVFGKTDDKYQLKTFFF